MTTCGTYEKICNVAGKVEIISGKRAVSRLALHHASCRCRTDIHLKDTRLSSIGMGIDLATTNPSSDCKKCIGFKTCRPVVNYTKTLLDITERKIIAVPYNEAMKMYAEIIAYGTDDAQLSYNVREGRTKYEEIDLSSVNDAFWLLYMYGAYDGPNFILFPYLSDSAWVSFYKANPKLIRGRDKLTSRVHPVFAQTKEMLEKLLERLSDGYDELDIDKQKFVTIVNNEHQKIAGSNAKITHNLFAPPPHS